MYTDKSTDGKTGSGKTATRSGFPLNPAKHVELVKERAVHSVVGSNALIQLYTVSRILFGFPDGLQIRLHCEVSGDCAEGLFECTHTVW